MYVVRRDGRDREGEGEELEREEREREGKNRTIDTKILSICPSSRLFLSLSCFHMIPFSSLPLYFPFIISFSSSFPLYLPFILLFSLPFPSLPPSVSPFYFLFLSSFSVYSPFNVFCFLPCHLFFFNVMVHDKKTRRCSLVFHYYHSFIYITHDSKHLS